MNKYVLSRIHVQLPNVMSHVGGPQPPIIETSENVFERDTDLPHWKAEVHVTTYRGHTNYWIHYFDVNNVKVLTEKISEKGKLLDCCLQTYIN